MSKYVHSIEYNYYYYYQVINKEPDYNGETRPAVGDIDGDGKAEIVVGLGPRGEGLMSVFDDAGTNYAFDRWLTVPHSQYNQAQGGSWPAIGDVVP